MGCTTSTPSRVVVAKDCDPSFVKDMMNAHAGHAQQYRKHPSINRSKAPVACRETAAGGPRAVAASDVECIIPIAKRHFPSGEASTTASAMTPMSPHSSTVTSPYSSVASSPAARHLRFEDAYDLGEWLGQGCYASVHVASPKAYGQRRGDAPEATALAVKVVRAQSKIDGLLPKQRKEMLVWLAVGSDRHCVRLHESFVGHDVMHLVMERAECNLLSMLTKHKMDSEIGAGKIFGQMFAGIAHCHSKSIIHRDVKPENYLVVAEGERYVIKLSDFGFGVVFDGKLLTGTYGSAPYLCPEMLLNEGHDFAADVWSCGASAYKLLFGEWLYKPPEPITIPDMKEAIRSNFPLPRFKHSSRSHTSTSAAVGGLGGLLRQVMIRDPKLRPSANNVIELLAQNLQR